MRRLVLFAMMLALAPSMLAQTGKVEQQVLQAEKDRFAAMIKGDRRMYFAGDHMTYLIGWMNGALESGRSVATQIHARAPQETRQTA